MSHDPHRPAPSRVALVTGVGRRRSIGAELALGLAADGWDLALGHWQPYDERLGYERGEDDPAAVAEECRALGSRVELLPGDLADPSTPEALVGAATERLGPVTGLVMSHCESVDSGVLSTSLESWDRHYAVNARASWLLIRAFAERLPVQRTGRTGSGPRRGPDERPHRATTCPTARARARWTASSSRRRSSSPTAACAPT